MSSTETDSQILVQSMMQRNPLKATSSETVQTALNMMLSNHVSALPVVDENEQLVGIVSLNDLMPSAQERASEAVAAVMTEAPLTVGSDETLRESAMLMIQHQVHHLPVVSSDKRLVGVVSSIDIVRLVADGMLRAAS
jgi:CBS domain-containing protein